MELINSLYFRPKVQRNFLENDDQSGFDVVGTTVPAVKMDVSGTIKVGVGGETCTATTKGSIRYNNTSNVLEFCNGAGWNLIQAAACTDPNPNVFLFTNQPNATASSLTNSDTIQITGINCSVPVTISGQGSPQYQICSDSGCSSIIQAWTTSLSSISNGQYLQTRLTTDSIGGATFQAAIVVGSGASVWTVTNAGGDCSGSPSVGTVCADGTIYAGLAAIATWPAPYLAAQNCENLNMNGNTDWYLPAANEILVLYSNQAAIKNCAAAQYWTSTETSGYSAQMVWMTDGASWGVSKEFAYYVRCVRR